MHMVKGLEFPVVFMVGMEEGLFPHSRALEDERELAEERRLCYVGMTRAKDLLYLVHAWRRTLYGQSEMHPRSRFIDEVPAELLRSATGARLEPSSGVRRPSSPGPPRPATERSTAEPARQIVQRFSAGDRIRHLKFGLGTVIRSTLTRHDEELIVKFDDAGLKIISATMAPLERTGD
jgi:DNA helicase-2/ATP-dependent DNA helicase PcrA